MHEYYTDPADPSALPRQRVTPVDGSKGGFFHRVFGGKDVVWREKPQPPMSGHNLKRPRPMPQLTSHNPHSASQGLGPTPPSTDTAQEKGTFGATPLPDNFWDLPWRERRYYEKMRAEQVRGMREWDKADRQRMIAEEMGAKMRMRAEEEERKWREKSEKRRWKEEIKEQEKMLKWQRKNPHRRMPIQTTSAVTSAAVQAIPAEGREQPTSWTMLPMLEDFGVRRPLDGPGRPANLGGPKDGPQWPMMSRTMTHAVVDMGREERMKMIQVDVRPETG